MAVFLPSGDGNDLYRDRVLRDGAVAYWRLDEASGLSLADATGHGHTATMPSSTGVTYGVTGALADGNNALSFDGTQGQTTCDAIALGTTFSVEFFMNVPVRPGAGQEKRVIGLAAAPWYGIYVYSADGTTDLKVSFYNAGEQTNTTNLTPGTMYHVMLSVTAGVGTWYINGVADGMVPAVPSWSPVALFNDVGDPVIGLFDELSLNPSALTAQQAAAHYGLRLAAPRSYPMAVRQVEQTWTAAAAASTGGLDGIAVLGDVLEWVCYMQSGAGCTATGSFQTAPSTAGPWATEASTDVSASEAAVFRGSGPIRAARPYVVAKSTGALTFTLIGNG